MRDVIFGSMLGLLLMLPLLLLVGCPPPAGAPTGVAQISSKEFISRNLEVDARRVHYISHGIRYGFIVVKTPEGWLVFRELRTTYVPDPEHMWFKLNVEEE